jgi:hypothetical protein
MAGHAPPASPDGSTTSITLVPGGSVTQNFYFGCSFPGGQPGAGPATSAPSAGRKRKRAWLAPFFGSTLSNALGAIVAATVLALAGITWAHYHHPGHLPGHGTRPAVTVSARR